MDNNAARKLFKEFIVECGLEQSLKSVTRVSPSGLKAYNAKFC